MTTTDGDEYDRTRPGFFHRSLSPHSFDKLRAEHSDYFYKPKRGPSPCQSNITITRPIKTFESVSKLVELLSNGAKTIKNQYVDNTFTNKVNEKTSPLAFVHDSTLSSMDSGNSSSKSSSTFSSRSNSSISTVPEQESHVIVIEESISELTQKPSFRPPEESNTTLPDTKASCFSSVCRVPAIGINISSTSIHLVLQELYPQNVDHSTIVFQRYLISLITDHEHHNWSISNVPLQTRIDQEANFRLFTLTRDEFDFVLVCLQSFINMNSSIASSFVLNIALTGEQTDEYEVKISSRLNRININFDIIQYRAESYMIGLDFCFGQNQDESIEVLENPTVNDKQGLYPYMLIHAEAGSTFFYIVHSASKYSVLISNNLCYETCSNLLKVLQPGHDEPISPPSPLKIRRPPPVSFDFTRQDLCRNCHRSSTTIRPSQIPLTSFTRLPQRYFPSNYSLSKTPHYIYRGWSNRRVSSYDKNLSSYDVHTQTDDSFLQSSSLQTRLAMHRSLLSMFTMNMALTIKLLLKLYPSVQRCVLTGEFFQLEKQAAQDITLFLRSIMGRSMPQMCQLKLESLIAALGCALPRVYFDVIDEDGILGNDCIH